MRCIQFKRISQIITSSKGQEIISIFIVDTQPLVLQHFICLPPCLISQSQFLLMDYSIYPFGHPLLPLLYSASFNFLLYHIKFNRACPKLSSPELSPKQTTKIPNQSPHIEVLLKYNRSFLTLQKYEIFRKCGDNRKQRIRNIEKIQK